MVLFGIVVIGLVVGLVVVCGAFQEQRGSQTQDVRRTNTPAASAPRRPQTARAAGHFSHQERNMNANHTKPTAHNGAQGASRQELDAAKTVHAFDFILKSFGQTPSWATAAGRDDYVHDLAVMLRHGDLARASLELLGADNTVIYRHRIEFGKNGGPGSVDAARGIELPLLAPGQVASHRILVGPAARTETYRHELRRNWSAAQRLEERAGSRFRSDHTRRVNAGRMTGEVFVADEARQTVTVMHVAAGGEYAFGRAPELATSVFLHRGQCDEPLTFQAGQRLSCVVGGPPDEGIGGPDRRSHGHGWCVGLAAQLAPGARRGRLAQTAGIRSGGGLVTSSA
jgi:hypothetical protein